MPSHKNNRDRIDPSQALMMGRYVQLSDKQSLSPEDQRELEYLSQTLSEGANVDLINETLRNIFGMSLIEVESDREPPPPPSASSDARPATRPAPPLMERSPMGDALDLANTMPSDTYFDRMKKRAMVEGFSGPSMNEIAEDLGYNRMRDEVRRNQLPPPPSPRLRSDFLSQVRANPAYDVGFRQANTEAEENMIRPNSVELENASERAEAFRNEISYGMKTSGDGTPAVDTLDMQKLGRLEYLEYLEQVRANEERESLMKGMNTSDRAGTGLVEEQPPAE